MIANIKVNIYIKLEILKFQPETAKATPLGIKNIPLLQYSTVPEELDYRDSSKVTSIKDQGSCGSCWAFAAAAQY